MTTLTIDRSGLSLADLVITADGSSSYELESFAPGRVERENTLAESRWRDGGRITSSRKAVTAMALVVRCHGTDVDDALTLAAALEVALGDQLSFTITELTDSTSIDYDCMAASVDIARDPVLLEGSIIVVSASIPRQP